MIGISANLFSFMILALVIYKSYSMGGDSLRKDLKSNQNMTLLECLR